MRMAVHAGAVNNDLLTSFYLATELNDAADRNMKELGRTEREQPVRKIKSCLKGLFHKTITYLHRVKIARGSDR